MSLLQNCAGDNVIENIVDSSDFFGEGDEDAFDSIISGHLQSQNVNSFQEIAQQTPMQEIQPVRTWITSQTEDCWFQFKEGLFSLVIKTTDPEIIENKWIGSGLRLLYQQSMLMVPPKIVGAPTFTEKSREVHGDTIRYLLRIEEISQRHQSKLFCFVFDIGNICIATDGFLVKTKRTKRKRTSWQPDCIESDYKKKTREVLEDLQWNISGYTSSCEGFVDFTRPIYTCTLCKGHKEQGHISGCPILELL
jgi:hypothetical protein